VAFDEGLVQRIHDVFAGAPDVVAKKMFGGVAFMVGGRMACGVIRNDLLVRVGRDAYEETLALPHVRQMDFTGRPMRGFVLVDAEGVAEDGDLEAWVGRGVETAASLPPG